MPRRKTKEDPPKPADGGLYAAALSSEERAQAGTAAESDLEDEIAMLRLFLRRVVHRSGEETGSLDDLLKALNSISLATARLSRLMESQRALGKDMGTAQAVAQALAELAEELNLR